MSNTMRLALLPLTLALALMLALVTILASGAESKPGGKPVPQDRIADVQLLGVNDFHGNLQSPRALPKNGAQVPVGGAEYLDAYLDEHEAKNPERTIRVHAGDMVGGTPLISSHFHDEPAVYAMNEMEFDVGTLGNHEFDEGGEEMLRMINGGHREDGLQFKDGADGQPADTSDPDFPGADFPYIAANTEYKDSGENVLPPYKIVKKDGIDVGFIGVTTEDTPNIVVPDAIAPFRITDISESVDKYVAELKARKVETIVVLAHSGGFFDNNAKRVTGEVLSETAEMSDDVDVVVAGHSHSKLNDCVDDQTGETRNAEPGGCAEDKLVIEAFSAGTAFDAVNMKVDRRTKDVIGSTGSVVTTFQDGVRPDARTAALVKEYKDRIAPVANRVVGTAAGDISTTANASGESAMGDLISDGQRKFAGADFAFMNPGGIRAPIAAGEVTYGELFSVQPFDNQVVKMQLTGEQVYRALEQQFGADGRTRILQVSGLKFSYNSTNPAGQRVTGVTLPDGTPVDRNATYTVAANSFIATGGDGFTVFKEGQNPETLGSDLDALEAHIESLPQPFTAPDPNMDPRITKQG
ncbi:MAG: 5'-nucleotidase C-terminal domain-containing protein [Rubrobacter sp.]